MVNTSNYCENYHLEIKIRRGRNNRIKNSLIIDNYRKETLIFYIRYTHI